MNTLTDRYVAAVLRRIPEHQRTDIDRELRASIDDAVEDRVAGGTSHEQAEEEIITGLGDPERLAAGYADRPLHLIGPGLYLEWRKVLRLLLSIVPPIVVTVLAIVGFVSGDGIVEVIVGAIPTGLWTALHIAFWVTLGFAVAERSGDLERDLPRKEWTPDQLPTQASVGEVTLGDTIGSVSFLLLAAFGLVVQQFASPIRDASGGAIPFFDPDLWSFWLPYLIVVLLAGAVVAVVAWRTGHWTYSLATIDTVLSVAVAAPMIWLALDESLLNRNWFDTVGWPEGGDPDRWLTSLIVSVVAITAIWTIVDVWIRAVRSARSRLRQSA